jgi:hypothetical protein
MVRRQKRGGFCRDFGEAARTVPWVRILVPVSYGTFLHSGYKAPWQKVRFIKCIGKMFE